MIAFPKTVSCPHCDGKGVLEITTHQVVKGVAQVSKMPIRCITCNGTAQVSPEIASRYQEWKEAWCRCQTPGEVTYVPDGGGVKHHWNCSSCGKLLQEG